MRAPQGIKAEALRLGAQGVPQGMIARSLRVTQPTVSRWLKVLVRVPGNLNPGEDVPSGGPDRKIKRMTGGTKK